MESLGERIYKIRRKAGFSQIDLANEMDVSRQIVSQWENNTLLPKLDRVQRMCELFNVDPRYFWVEGEAPDWLGKEDRNDIEPFIKQQYEHIEKIYRVERVVRNIDDYKYKTKQPAELETVAEDSTAENVEQVVDEVKKLEEVNKTVKKKLSLKSKLVITAASVFGAFVIAVATILIMAYTYPEKGFETVSSVTWNLPQNDIVVLVSIAAVLVIGICVYAVYRWIKRNN